VSYYNQRAVELWGRTPKLNDPVDKFCGSFKLFSTDGTPIQHDICWMALAIQENKSYDGYEIVIEREDGSRFTALAHANPIYDDFGTLAGAVNVLVDITERKEIEESLRRSEQKFSTLADAMPQLVWTSNADGALDYFNQRWFEYTGTYEEHLGWGWQNVIHPDDLERITADWKHSLATGETVIVEYRLRRYDGVYRWHLTRAVALKNEAGRVIKWFGTSTDIHKQKEAERILKDADHRKDEFLAIPAHELRSPLAPIRTALEILQRGTDLKLKQKAQNIIEKQVTHIVRLVDDLLDISRIAQGKIKLQIERVELKDVIDSALETTSPIIESAGHTITISLPDAPIYLDADSVRLTQVFLNLLTNAAKYSEPNRQISLIAEHLGDTVAVSVKDTGFGIPFLAIKSNLTVSTRPNPTMSKSVKVGLRLSNQSATKFSV